MTNLLLKRVNYFGGLKGVGAFSELDSLFDKNEMRQRARPVNYILRRTMMRPRDIICLLGKTVKVMREKSSDPFCDEEIEFEKIECESIYLAEPVYSEWLRQEVLDEWKVQKPIMVNLLQALQNGGSTNFTQQDFAEQLRKLVSNVSDAEVLDHLRFLFNNSIIGFQLGSSTEWKFKCFHPSQGFLESDVYKVHDGLVRALNLTEPREREASKGSSDA